MAKLSTYAMMALSWPSYVVLRPLGLGATPLGVILAPFFIRRISIFDAVMLLVFGFLVALGVCRTLDYLEGVLLLVGPLVYLTAKSVFADKCGRSENWFRISVFVMVLCILDSLFGQFNSAGPRSTTLLTYEPSHTARLFSVFSIIAIIQSKRIAFLLLASLVFSVFNASVTALLGLLVNMLLCLIRSGRDKRLAAIFLLAILFGLFLILPSQGIQEHRAFEYLFSIPNVLMFDQLVDILNVLGGPRLVLTGAGFYHSSMWGSGVGTGVFLGLVSKGTDFDPATVPYIGTLGVEVNSYMSQIAFETGWLGVIVLIFWLAPLRSRDNTLGRRLIWVFAWVSLVLFSTTTMPTPWVLLALANSGLWRNDKAERANYI